MLMIKNSFEGHREMGALGATNSNSSDSDEEERSLENLSHRDSKCL